MGTLTCCHPGVPTTRWPDETDISATAWSTISRCRSSAVQLAEFRAATTFVGTNFPHHADDGEGPRREVRLNKFALETFPVTNSRFALFVKDTGYITTAERLGWAAVFAEVSDGANGWRPVSGACWSSPEGSGSSIDGRADHPVVQVDLADAAAFAAWAGGRLPSEAEWEHAARGGLEDPRFPWGDEEPDDRRILCNIWQGSFPKENTRRDGYFSTNPAGVFPPNAAGLYDMAGNVWEWTADPFRVNIACAAAERRNAAAIAGKEGLLKGGSFLCHRSYCYRYRIAARLALGAESCGNNVGFRVAYDG